MISIFISNNIRITGLDDKLRDHICQALTLDNPLFYRLTMMARRDASKRRALFACPQSFKYYKINGDTLEIPRGMRSRLIKFLKAVGEEYTISEDVVAIPSRATVIRNLKLRDWQELAVTSVLGENTTEGLLIAGTGSGKTICLLEIAVRLGLTCTILTSKTSMVKQWKDELMKFYGIEAGEIHAKTKTIADFTIATFQSLLQPTAMAMELVNKTSILIVDEAQESVADGKSKVLSRFKPKYLFGTTATMRREDKQDEAIKFYCGDVLYEHQETMEKPVVEIINTGIKIEVDEYPRMIEELTRNEDRNNLIVGTITLEAVAKRKILVLTKRVEHAEVLYRRFADWNGVYLISAKNKEKDQLLADFKRGEKDFNIIFGTTALLSVAVDIPPLDTLILACDMKAETLLIQSSGRILRLWKGKADPKIIDFNDGDRWDNETKKKEVLNIIFLRQFQQRMRIYKDKGWEVKF